MYGLARSALFRLEAERAHRLTLAGLNAAHRLGLLSLLPAPPAQDPVRLMGLTFPNRVGVAAGFDKDAGCVDALAGLGFGFVEVGTLTPHPQTGNPRPRVFRLPQARAVINRMGFPNEGVEAAVERLKGRRAACVCGVNIGKNAATPQDFAAADYAAALRAVYGVADYVVINLSSPNTAGLRSLQGSPQLRPLLNGLLGVRGELIATTGRRVPMVVKLSPDLSDEELADTAEVIGSLCLDGVIATNTTTDRAAVEGLAHADRPGGLSGEPLRERSRAVVARLRKLLGPGMTLIGVGGISSAADARAMLDAGANLVQVYTALIYRGPGLVRELTRA